MANDRYDRLVGLVGPQTLALIAESINLGKVGPADVGELELVVEWVVKSWATECLVSGVLEGSLIVLIRDGQLTFHGRTAPNGWLQ